MNQQFRQGLTVGLLTYVVWGLLTVFWKQLHHFQAFELIGWRVVCSGVVMAIVVALVRGWSPLRSAMAVPSTRRRVVLASLLLTVNWTSYVWAVVHDHVLETALGYFMAPLGTMAVGVLVLHERIRRAQVAAVVLAVAAIAVLTASYGRVPWLALFIAASWTSYGYLKRQVPLSPVQSMAAETFVLTVPAALLAVALAARSDSIPHTATGIQLVLVALTGPATVVPLMCFAYAAKRLPLTVLGPMQYIVPTINFLLGWLAYDEGLSWAKVVGFSLVWCGLGLMSWDVLRRAGEVRRHGSLTAGYAGTAS